MLPALSLCRRFRQARRRCRIRGGSGAAETQQPHVVPRREWRGPDFQSQIGLGRNDPIRQIDVSRNGSRGLLPISRAGLVSRGSAQRERSPGEAREIAAHIRGRPRDAVGECRAVGDVVIQRVVKRPPVDETGVTSRRDAAKSDEAREEEWKLRRGDLAKDGMRALGPKPDPASGSSLGSSAGDQVV